MLLKEHLIAGIGGRENMGDSLLERGCIQRNWEDGGIV